MLVGHLCLHAWNQKLYVVTDCKFGKNLQSVTTRYNPFNTPYYFVVLD